MSAVTGPASATSGQQISVSVTVCNQGTVGGSAPVEVYLSADATITPNGPTGPSPDFFVGYAGSPYLNAGQCQVLTVSGPAYASTEGAYYLGAVVDPQNSLSELIENNNTLTGSRIGVGNRPDFIVSAASSASSVKLSQTLTVSVTVCNQGTVGGNAPVEVYLSADSTITPNGPTGPSPDFFVGYVSLPYLNPGQCQVLTVSGPASVPTTGLYYAGAVVDPQSSIAELIDDNNTRAGTRVSVTP
ncbi:hypothetical protein D7V97_08315 [Corallococcus sp. CA053C]|nr:hypothetical protein D7V97_08315 [Corallococcus sp. CA053C]